MKQMLEVPVGVEVPLGVTALGDARSAEDFIHAWDPARLAINAWVSIAAKTPDGTNLYIADVLQKAMVAVQETGVEAAAATAVVVRSDGDSGPPPVVVDLNRPFLISIIDVPTGAILFLGHIEDPTDEGSP